VSETWGQPPPPVPFSYCSHRQGAWDQRPYAQEGGQHHDGGSARAAFARCGYDGIGVREIAKAVGVTGILVSRYFGSKEQLFSEVIASTMANPGILSNENLAEEKDLAGIGRRIATALVMKTRQDAEELDGFLILLRSASNERAALIWRENIEQHYEKSLAARLSGTRVRERAALILALIAGVQIMRQAIGTTSLVESDLKWLTEQLTELFQSLVEPERLFTAKTRSQ
jgi:AcrR family transcriptional regulator